MEGSSKKRVFVPFIKSSIEKIIITTFFKINQRILKLKLFEKVEKVEKIEKFESFCS